MRLSVTVGYVHTCMMLGSVDILDKEAPNPTLRSYANPDTNIEDLPTDQTPPGGTPPPEVGTLEHKEGTLDNGTPPGGTPPPDREGSSLSDD